ncbi:MAG: type IX secretion system protein PorQ [Saprospiraceae bacterium]
MQKNLLILTLVLTSWQMSLAQLGGQHTFAFLNLSPSARVSGLAGNLITVVDDDVNLAYANPSLLNPLMHQQISFQHNFHLGKIQNGYASYAQYFDKLQMTFHAGIQYINYGELNLTNEFGDIEGTFQANENAVVLGAARPIDERLTIGANLKFITSRLETYNSIGFSSDIAATYADTANRFVATIVFKNVGSQISTYTEDNFEPLPFEIQVGISKRLRYLPFRFSIIYHNLQDWNIRYNDPNREDEPLFFGEGGNSDSETSIFIDNLFRHFIFNGELLVGARENFRLRLGYNHFLRRELTVNNLGSLAGFSFGVGIKVNRFRIDYGRTIYHIAGGLNHLGISTNFQEFRR